MFSRHMLVPLLVVAIGFFCPFLAYALNPDYSHLTMEERVYQLEQNADLVWMIVAAFIVFLMQGGYLLYEAGLVRSKNSINVAQKNLADAFISATFYYLIGFNIMFGHSVGGIFGWGLDYHALKSLSPSVHTFFVYQIVFCGTVATIVSGAMAERLKFGSYLASTAFISMIIYPVFGHWTWGNKLDPLNHSFLTDDGFIDFAGGTVVCSLGGWVSLAGLMVVGPRMGKYGPNGEVYSIQGHSIVLAAFGGLVLWLGTLAFNSGLAHAGSEELAHVISNTILAGSFAGLTGLALGRIFEGIYRPERSIYGMLGGIAAIAAGCHVFSTASTLLISIVAGAICYGGFTLLTRKFKIDDAVCAIPINGLCGAWGTLMVGPLMDTDLLPAGATHISQTLVQLEGIVVAFVWAFGMSFIFFKLLDRFVGLRVSPEEEEIGLNTAEHGATLGTGALQEALYDIVHGDHDLTRRLDETTGDESAEIAHLFNKFVERIQFLMIDISQNARVLNSSSERLSFMSNKFSESFEQIFKESGNLDDSSQVLSTEVDGAANVAESISSEVSEIAKNAKDMAFSLSEVSKSVANMTSSIHQIAHNANNVSEVTNEARTQSSRASVAMNQLAQAIDRIDGVVDLIKEIAEQTNMLALNAIIESARAGEAGKGFSVVANEVKNLAEQTASATEDITARIEEVNRSTGDVKVVIGEIIQIIESVNESITSISDAANTQSDSTNMISERVTQSAKGAETVSDAINKVSAGAHSVYENMSHAAKHLARVLTSVEQFTTETRANQDSADNVKKTSSDLSRIADELVDTVNEYKL